MMIHLPGNTWFIIYYSSSLLLTYWQTTVRRRCRAFWSSIVTILACYLAMMLPLCWQAHCGLVEASGSKTSYIFKYLGRVTCTEAHLSILTLCVFVVL